MIIKEDVTMHILLSVNADSSNNQQLLDAAKLYQKRGVLFSVVYVVPEVVLGACLSMPLVADGVSTMLLQTAREYRAGEVALVELGNTLGIPKARQHLVVGSLSGETKKIAKKIAADAIIGYNATLLELLQKTSLYRAWRYLRTLVVGYHL